MRRRPCVRRIALATCEAHLAIAPDERDTPIHLHLVDHKEVIRDHHKRQ